ncbi:MAG: 16S rRNA (cytidine(1402)-2'-O)-methyltransferase [Oscillospiraceae bacterium]
MAGTLYLVPTPIGNLGDISVRIAKTLEDADFIAAEDTRISVKLLNHLGLKKPMVSYYRHNSGPSGRAILERMLAGESCALVTDAGTPAVSDPGEELVALCAANDVNVIAIPGPCALVTALAVSGLPTGRFTFEGFLAMNKKNRKAHLDSLKTETRTMIFYEAPHKLTATLSDLLSAFGPDRRISLCRELSKLHEEVKRTTLGEAVTLYGENSPKGEFVLVLEGCAEVVDVPVTEEDALSQVSTLRGQGLSLKDAVRQVSISAGLPKNQLYDLAVAQSAQEF